MCCFSLLVWLATSSGPHQATLTKMTPFNVRGSDGKKYTLASLTAGKPVLLFYLEPAYKTAKVDKTFGLVSEQRIAGFEMPDRTADLNRLVAMTRGTLRVVALCHATPAEMQWLRNHHGVKFLMVGDDKPYSAMNLLNQMLIPDIGGMGQSGLSSLQNMLILPDGRCGRIWQGLGRPLLSEMQADLRRYTGTSLHLDLTKFPMRIQVGSLSMYGTPH